MSPAHPYEATSIQLPTDEWIRKMWYVHVMEYYLASKKGILSNATTQMNLEDITLTERSWPQRAKYSMIPSI